MVISIKYVAEADETWDFFAGNCSDLVIVWWKVTTVIIIYTEDDINFHLSIQHLLRYFNLDLKWWLSEPHCHPSCATSSKYKLIQLLFNNAKTKLIHNVQWLVIQTMAAWAKNNEQFSALSTHHNTNLPCTVIKR